MLKKLILPLVLFTIIDAQLLDFSLQKEPQKYNNLGIVILDTKEYRDAKKSLFHVSEISDLCFDKHILYAVGDKGYLYHFSFKVDHDKIKTLTPIKMYKLKNKKHKRFKKKSRDAEGLVCVDKTLMISFEHKHRVELFTLDGVKLKKLKTHKALEDRKKYQGKNKGLEALVYSPKYGVITAPEVPLRGERVHTIYAKYQTWKLDVEGSITAFELIDDEHLLILLRDFNYITRRRVTTLLEFSLEDNTFDVLAKLDSRDDWEIDNFEGLTKVGANRYLMVSDDNDSIFQKTLFVLFKIRD